MVDLRILSVIGLQTAGNLGSHNEDVGTTGTEDTDTQKVHPTNGTTKYKRRAPSPAG